MRNAPVLSRLLLGLLIVVSSGTLQAQVVHPHAGGSVPPPFAQPFPNLLGNTVGLQAFPQIGGAIPGIGNINHPGTAPGSPVFMPNINNPAGQIGIGIPNGPAIGPGGIPGWGQPGFQPGIHGERHHRGPGQFRGTFQGGWFQGGPVVYGVPYAVPYYIYVMPYGYTDQPPAPAAPPEPAPAPSSSSAATNPLPPRIYHVPAETTGEVSGQPPDTANAQEAPAIVVHEKVTLLAFKNNTLVVVTDYWLEGDLLFYDKGGSSASVPLSDLDLPLTQKLNRERNVPFVLEARP